MLALFHGPTGCAAEWNALRAHLPPSLRLNCFAPDLDYLGQSPEEIATDLRAHLAARQVPRLVIAAHGLGGAVALRLADMADEVVLVAPPVRVEEALIPTRPETGEIWFEALAHRPERIAHFDFHRMIAMEQLAGLLSDSADPAVLGRLRAEGAALLGHPALSQGGVRVIAGTEDRVAAAGDLAPHLPEGRLQVMPEAGHLVALEVPQVLARVLGQLHGAVSPLTRPPIEVNFAP